MPSPALAQTAPPVANAAQPWPSNSPFAPRPTPASLLSLCVTQQPCFSQPRAETETPEPWLKGPPPTKRQELPGKVDADSDPGAPAR